MCIVSAVVDGYRDYWNRKPGWGVVPIDYTPNQLFPDIFSERKELEDLRAFKKAVDAAKEVDKITGAPDCEEPERKKLLVQILERLEALEKKVNEII